MPDLTNIRWITINAPYGPCNVSNPLYEYTFHPQPAAADFPPDISVCFLLHSSLLPLPDQLAPRSLPIERKPLLTGTDLGISPFRKIPGCRREQPA